MIKNISKEESNKFLLSLNLFNCKNNNLYLKTLYAISNNVEKNYKGYKIKDIVLFMNQTLS